MQPPVHHLRARRRAAVHGGEAAGVREPFDPEKVRSGVERAVAGSAIDPAAVDELVAEVEERLRAIGPEVTSEQVGRAVLEGLRRLDPVSYLRFARSTRASRTSATSSERSPSCRSRPSPSAAVGLEFAVEWGSLGSGIDGSGADRGNPCNDSAVVLSLSFPTTGGDGGAPTTTSCGFLRSKQGSARARTSARARRGRGRRHMAIAPQQVGIGIRRYFTRPGVNPYDEVDLGAPRRVHHELAGRLGRLRAARRRVPRLLVVQRHQHRRPEVLPRHARHRRARDQPEAGHRPHRRHDHRVGRRATATSSTSEEAETFRDELKHLLITQKAAFNSPVWFNIGVKGVPQQGSACFILAVEDSMDSILNWYTRGGHHLQGRLRRRRQPLEDPLERTSCSRAAAPRAGPVSLHARRRRVGRHHQVRRQDPPRGEDGHPRRGSPRHRGVHLVQGRRGEEGPRAARRRLRHGPRRQGHPRDPVPERQQLGARLRRVHAGRASTTPTGASGLARDRRGRRAPSRPANSCARSRSAAWECADPGMQFDTTINDWHTSPNTGRINGSNPCSEYMHIDNSACNLASLNLLKFLDDDGTLRRRRLQGSRSR